MKIQTHIFIAEDDFKHSSKTSNVKLCGLFKWKVIMGGKNPEQPINSHLADKLRLL